jgi:Icc protein
MPLWSAFLRVFNVVNIVQLSDCHVTGEVGRTYRGSDPRASLEAIIDAVLDWNPDLVLATGDFSEDASAASYAYLAEQFSRLPMPVLGTPGNHDTAEGLRVCLPRSAVDELLTFPSADELSESAGDDAWQLMLLGSAKPGEIGGRFEDRQLDEFEAALGTGQGPVLVALHHQPWPVGSPWIDRYALAAPERFHAILAAHPRVRLVLWGHVHQAVRLEVGEGQVGLGAPSTVSNSLPGRPRFTVDPAGPACRWLRLAENGSFATGLLRPDRADPSAA